MKGGLLVIFIWIAAIIGEIRCIYQFCTSDFEPNYKREIVYGVAACTGLGAIVGYINIADNPEAK
jgi:hypothetical protein